MFVSQVEDVVVANICDWNVCGHVAMYCYSASVRYLRRLEGELSSKHAVTGVGRVTIKGFERHIDDGEVLRV